MIMTGTSMYYSGFLPNYVVGMTGIASYNIVKSSYNVNQSGIYASFSSPQEIQIDPIKKGGFGYSFQEKSTRPCRPANPPKPSTPTKVVSL